LKRIPWRTAAARTCPRPHSARTFARRRRPAGSHFRFRTPFRRRRSSSPS
jgi:hypothetical protein